MLIWMGPSVTPLRTSRFTERLSRRYSSVPPFLKSKNLPPVEREVFLLADAPYEAGDLGGPPPKRGPPRSTCTDCLYGVVTLMTTVAVSVNGGVVVPS